MKKKIPPRYLRIITMLIVVAFVIVGLVTHLAPGTLSSFGIESIALICPLGSLEVLLASKTIVPLALTSLICLIIIAVLVGRIFCGWVCPVPLYRIIFSPRKALAKSDPDAADEDDVSNHTAQADRAQQNGGEKVASACSAAQPSRFHTRKISLPHFDSRFIVLIGALVATAIFGFPVFCLVCPIGLTYGFIIGIWRLIGFNEPTWLLLIFPALLLIELVFFKKWCHKICPIGALISLVSSLNVTLRPRVDTTKCLRTTQGIACMNCKDACFEEINLHDAIHSRSMSECTKCRECSAACPVGAISFHKKKIRLNDSPQAAMSQTINPQAASSQAETLQAVKPQTATSQSAPSHQKPDK